MKKKCKVLASISVFCTLLLFLVQYRNSLPSYQQGLTPTKGFVTLDFTTGRMGNKLFHLIDGYALARDLNRRFYLRSNDMSWLKDGLEEILNAFPKLNSTFTLISKDIVEKRPATHSPYSASNAFNATLSQSSLCVHIRRTDFVNSNSGSMMESTYAMTEMLLKHQNGGFISEFSPGMDLYLSSRLCHSFLISAPVSTFGFWLGYVIPNQQNVFYRIEDGNQMGKQIERDLFPPSWRPLKVLNETIVLLAD